MIKKFGNIRRFISAALFCLLAGVFITSNITSDVRAAIKVTDAKVQSYEEKLSKLEKERKELQVQISQAQKDIKNTAELKNLYDKEINNAERRKDDLLQLIAELGRTIAETEEDIIARKIEIENQYEKITQILRVSYEEGTANYLEMLVDADSLYDFFTRIERIGNMLDYNKKIMQQYESDKLALETRRAELNDKIEYQNDQKDLLDKSIKEIEQLSEKNVKAMEAASKDLTVAESIMKKNIEEEQKLDKELEAYLKELQEKNKTEYVGGELGWPVELTTKRISSGYGYRTLNGVREFHYGIDIPDSYAKPVYAANAGKVVKAEWHSSYGYYILIDHGGGKATLYAHNSKLLVSVGQEVSKGEKIAQIGNTGNSYGNHLHFEVRINGVRTNPMDYVVQPK